MLDSIPALIKGNAEHYRSLVDDTEVRPGTVAVLRAVRELRQEGLEAWATLDAGANVHVICDPDSEDEVAERLEDLPAVGFVIRDGVGDGPEHETPHLFEGVVPM